MTDLRTFLIARLNEDAETAAEATSRERHPWALSLVEDHYSDSVVSIEPSRVLAEVAAKRAVLDLYRVALQKKNWPACTVLEDVLPLLVQPYAGHPDFDPAWSWASR